MKSRRNLLVASITLTSLLVTLTGCAGPKAANVPQKGGEVSGAVISGTVTETMDSGGYTYVYLKSAGKHVWAALPATRLSVGQNIRIYGGAVMQQFSSKALNRTFDAIVFSGGVVPEPGAGASPGRPESTDANNEVGKPVLVGTVVETINVGAYTYILLENDGRRGWSAIPRAELKVGDSVEVLPGTDMVDFKSAKLKRSFPYILFSGGIKGAADKPQPKLENAEAPSAVPSTAQQAQDTVKTQ